MICPIDSLFAVLLMRMDLLPFVFESCFKYCANGMEQNVTAKELEAELVSI